MMGVIHMITRYDDVQMVLKDGKTFSSKANARGIGIVMGRTILEMEGKEHVRFRNIITPFFGPRAMKAEMPASWSSSIINRLIDEFAGAGAADLVQQFTFSFPMQVMADDHRHAGRRLPRLPPHGARPDQRRRRSARAASRRRRIWSPTCRR